ncbi:hypothetical protein ACSIGC_16395 [Tenacibaculum sp. ZS6-P6]|uniref:hypothetical protein n=1 Tax=Tenacibaculum sp. ZS6-P6 TaxID=3447503 RepID=UPI003F9B28C4
MKLFKKFTNEKLEKSVLKNITGGNSRDPYYNQRTYDPRYETYTKDMVHDDK